MLQIVKIEPRQELVSETKGRDALIDVCMSHGRQLSTLLQSNDAETFFMVLKDLWTTQLTENREHEKRRMSCL